MLSPTRLLSTGLFRSAYQALLLLGLVVGLGLWPQSSAAQDYRAIILSYNDDLATHLRDSDIADPRRGLLFGSRDVQRDAEAVSLSSAKPLFTHPHPSLLARRFYLEAMMMSRAGGLMAITPAGPLRIPDLRRFIDRLDLGLPEDKADPELEPAVVALNLVMPPNLPLTPDALREAVAQTLGGAWQNTQVFVQLSEAASDQPADLQHALSLALPGLVEPFKQASRQDYKDTLPPTRLSFLSPVKRPQSIVPALRDRPALDTLPQQRDERAVLPALVACDGCDDIASDLSSLVKEKKENQRAQEEAWLTAVREKGDIEAAKSYIQSCQLCSDLDAVKVRLPQLEFEAREAKLVQDFDTAPSWQAGLAYLIHCEDCAQRRRIFVAMGQLRYEAPSKPLGEVQAELSCLQVAGLGQASAEGNSIPAYARKDFETALSSCDVTQASQRLAKARGLLALGKVSDSFALLEQLPDPSEDAIGRYGTTLRAWLDPETQDLAQKLPALAEQSQAGDASATLLLAELLLTSERADRDAMAAKLLPRLQALADKAQTTDPLTAQARTLMGLWREQGFGGLSKSSGFEDFRAAALANNPDALGYLARYFENGVDAPQNTERAADLYALAIERGSPQALASLSKKVASHSNELYAALQQRAQLRGLYFGDIDGLYGAGTQAAFDDMASLQGQELAAIWQPNFRLLPSLHRDLPDPGDNIQYIALAFDGSKDIDMWKETRAFARQHKLKFTYFISGVYFLSNDSKDRYQGPGKRTGRSDIGFGGTAEEVAERVEQVVLANREGHEIGSHANGHFNGGKWSSSDWRKEYRQFHDILENVHSWNGIEDRFGQEWTNIVKNVVGFRAPLLGHSPGLWSVMQEFGYRYDTSRILAQGYVPEQDSHGIWNFALNSVRSAAGRTVSMDYNFYYLDSKGRPDPSNSALYEQRMLDAYRVYFNRQYRGDRAPLHIGHHFSKWNGGAYWRAMQRFAIEVCGKPDVRCITYRELADIMEARKGS